MAGVNNEAYIEDPFNYGTIPYREKKKPMDSWAAPFVIGHKYKIHWGLTGVDFDQMQIEVSERYLEADEPVYFVHNFTDVRAEYDVRFNDGWNDAEELVANDTIGRIPQDWVNGANVLYNMTDTREFHFIVSGKYA